MVPDSEIISLARLLDDEDEAVAVTAIAELINREDELGDLPAVLQDFSSPLLRRRVHQLQAALAMRRRRREFAKKLARGHVDFIDGLIDVHLQWFDNDSRPALERSVEEFRSAARRRPAATLDDLAAIMRRMRFAVEAETTLRPENYCIGVVIADRVGAGSLLAGVTRYLADEPAEYRVVRVNGDFALFDGGGKLLTCAHDWRITEAPPVGEMEFFEDRALLRLASATLFSCAVNSDSFRYVLTIAQALTGARDDSPLDYLPYPFRPAEDEGDDADPDAGAELGGK